MLLLNPRRTRTNMKLLQLVGIFLLTLCGQSAVIKIQVKEDGEAILDCSFGTTNIKNEPFAWKKDVDQSNEEVFWYSGGDTDPGSEFKGASPQPIVIHHKADDGVLLQCVVRGAFPQPEVEWWDSDGNVLAVGDPQMRDGKENKYDTVLNVTVIKTGHYRCVATQKEIKHQIYTKTHANVGGGASKPNAKEINETKDGILLQCVVQDPSPQTKVFWKDSAGQDVPSKEQKTENSIILWATVTTTDDYRCVTTEGKKDDELYDEIRVRGPDGTSIGWIIGVAVAALFVGVAVGVVVRHFCCKKRAGGSTTEARKKDII